MLADLDPGTQLVLVANLALLLTLVAVTAGPPLLQELKALVTAPRRLLVAMRVRRALKRAAKELAMARAVQRRVERRQLLRPHLRVTQLPMPTMSSPSSAS